MLTYEVWVLKVREKLFCVSSVRIGFEYRKRKVHGDQITAHRVVELLPRRLRWPCGVAGTTSAYRWGGRPQPSRHQREERRRSRGPQEGSSLHRSSSWQSPARIRISQCASRRCSRSKGDAEVVICKIVNFPRILTQVRR